MSDSQTRIDRAAMSVHRCAAGDNATAIHLQAQQWQRRRRCAAAEDRRGEAACAANRRLRLALGAQLREMKSAARLTATRSQRRRSTTNRATRQQRSGGRKKAKKKKRKKTKEKKRARGLPGPFGLASITGNSKMFEACMLVFHAFTPFHSEWLQVFSTPSRKPATQSEQCHCSLRDCHCH